jgi:RES domain
MDAITFLADPLLRLPLVRPSDDFEFYVTDLFERFKQQLDQVTGADGISDRIVRRRGESHRLCDRIIAAIHVYLDGYPGKAFNEINTALAAVASELNSVMATADRRESLECLYRIRTSNEPGERFTRQDLFHIPFDKRHKVATQRFSIPGLPCLYLGGSIDVCWEELRKPAFTTVHIARFKGSAGATLRLVNLSERPQYWTLLATKDPGALNVPKNQEYVAAQTILRPLMAACHIKVLHSDGSFRPEYIVPQILLEWVRATHGYDGICYTSTHIESTFIEPMGQRNFVFAAKQMRPEGHCPELMQQFELSEALSWQRAEAIGDNDGSNPFPYLTDFEIESVTGVRTKYLHTAFYSMQWRLNGLRCSPL